MTNKVFVYGSLKQGHWNNSILGDSPFLGEGVTIEDHFTMYDGGFPYVTINGRFKVKGELYEITDESTWRSLDRLEGVPHLYIRKDVTVRVDDEVHNAILYVASPLTQRYLEQRTHRSIEPNDNNEVEWLR